MDDTCEAGVSYSGIFVCPLAVALLFLFLFLILLSSFLRCSAVTALCMPLALKPMKPEPALQVLVSVLGNAGSL